MFSVHGRDPSTGEVVAVDLDGDRIVGVRPADWPTDVWISPGLIDLQVNGFGGLDVNAPSSTPETIAALVRVLAARGTTTFLPTVVTNSSPGIARLLAVIRRARELDTLSRHAIPCVHLEGPWISPEEGYRGAHDAKQVAAPSLDDFDRWQAVSGNLIGMVTLSPHWGNAVFTIQELRRRGIVVAIGHTHANPQQIRDAADAGATLSTHLGNGLPATLHRHNNPLWPQLAEGRLTATVIADGFHLPDELLRVILAVKGESRSVLVSDSVALAGSVPGDYQTPVGDAVTIREDGSIRIRGTELLAGSGISLIEAVGHAASVEDIGLGQAMRMATANPGRILGQRVELKAGAPGDLLLFRWQPGNRQMRVEQVYVAGQRIVAPCG